MTVNELLLELMKLTLEGKGDYRIQVPRGYELEDISRVDTMNHCKVATLEA